MFNLNQCVLVMDRSWISNPDRLSAEYENGVGEFVTFVRGSFDVQGLTKCPCNRCMNREVMYDIIY